MLRVLEVLRLDLGLNDEICECGDCGESYETSLQSYVFHHPYNLLDMLSDIDIFYTQYIVDHHYHLVYLPNHEHRLLYMGL